MAGQWHQFSFRWNEKETNKQKALQLPASETWQHASRGFPMIPTSGLSRAPEPPPPPPPPPHPPICAYLCTRTSNSSFWLSLCAWNLHFKIHSNAWKIPLKNLPSAWWQPLIFFTETTQPKQCNTFLKLCTAMSWAVKSKCLMKQWLKCPFNAH